MKVFDILMSCVLTFRILIEQDIGFVICIRSTGIHMNSCSESVIQLKYVVTQILIKLLKFSISGDILLVNKSDIPQSVNY